MRRNGWEQRSCRGKSCCALRWSYGYCSDGFRNHHGSHSCCERNAQRWYCESGDRCCCYGSGAPHCYRGWGDLRCHCGSDALRLRHGCHRRCRCCVSWNCVLLHRRFDGRHRGCYRYVVRRVHPHGRFAYLHGFHRKSHCQRSKCPLWLR